MRANNVREFQFRLLVGLFGWLVLLPALAHLVDRLLGWQVEYLLVRSLYCPCHRHPGHGPEWTVGGFAVGHTVSLLLVGLGVGTLLWRLWQTQQGTARLLKVAGLVPLPAEVTALLPTLNLAGKVVVVQTAAPLAFCFGFLRPRICLSVGLVELLSSEQLRAVLLHEAYHQRRCDPLRLLLAEALAQMLFFLPAVQEWHRLFPIQLELAADRHAVQQGGKRALAGALHRLLTHPTPATLPSGLLVAGLGATAARIAELIEERPALQPISARSLVRTALIIYASCLLHTL